MNPWGIRGVLFRDLRNIYKGIVLFFLEKKGGDYMDCDFYKYHALGNDYIVIDPQKTKVNLSEENIRLICHRNFGIGSDGILYGPLFHDTSIYFKIFNPLKKSIHIGSISNSPCPM